MGRELSEPSNKSCEMTHKADKLLDRRHCEPKKRYKNACETGIVGLVGCGLQMTAKRHIYHYEMLITKYLCCLLFFFFRSSRRDSTCQQTKTRGTFSQHLPFNWQLRTQWRRANYWKTVPIFQNVTTDDGWRRGYDGRIVTQSVNQSALFIEWIKKYSPSFYVGVKILFCPGFMG